MPVQVPGRRPARSAGPLLIRAPAAPPRLEVLALTRSYGPVRALDEVSFTLEPGEFLVVLGPNGAGKTTLVRTLARLSRPTAGAVLLDGKDWLKAPSERRREVGVLSHATHLYDGLTAAENLAFHAVLYGLADPSARARAALGEVGLSDRADRPAGTLSRGQAQRLAIARAVLHEPRLLLLDEPYAGLDPHAAARLGEALAALRSAGRTIVLTTHDLARAPAAATHYLVLVDGRVRTAGDRRLLPEGRVAELYDRAVAASRGAGAGA